VERKGSTAIFVASRPLLRDTLMQRVYYVRAARSRVRDHDNTISQ
jgi:hypothetical protein